MWDQLESAKAQSLSTRKFKAGAGLVPVTGKSLFHDIYKILLKLIMMPIARIDTNPST
jgi:hypothetical protein